ncbi:MAG TPA: hypothetical protein VGQ53_16045 [Chitinophagaceae bacterium]|nr:hypothetical protein [Chitinophagaceae bacterium]
MKSVISSLFMIMALLWLTVSTPFVFASQQAQQKEIQKQTGSSEDRNPFSTTTEEKNESSASTLSEYLHDLNSMTHHFIVLTRIYKCHTSDLYYAYHPELLSPPPEV